MLKKIGCLVLAILFIQTPAVTLAYFGMDNIPYDFVFDGCTLEEALQEAILIFEGNSSWEGARLQTSGYNILEKEREGGRISLSVITAVSVFDIREAQLRCLTCGYGMARVVFEAEGDGYRLRSYLIPEDGEQLAYDYQSLFSNAVYQKIQYTDSFFALAETAEEIALLTAEKCLKSEADLQARGVRIFLQAGSNPKALDTVWGSPLIYQYPSFEGACVRHGKRYCLHIEGEKSYSGILIYSSFDENNERITYCKVQAVEDELIVLDGELPEPTFD